MKSLLTFLGILIFALNLSAQLQEPFAVVGKGDSGATEVVYQPGGLSLFSFSSDFDAPVQLLESELKYSGKYGSIKIREKVRRRTKGLILHSQNAHNPENKTLHWTGTVFSGKNDSSNINLKFTPHDSTRLDFSIDTDSTSHWNGFSLTLPRPADQPVFGFGEQFSHLDLAGKAFWLIAEEQGVGRGDPGVSFWTRMVGAKGHEFSTYCPIPFCFLSPKHALFLDNSAPLFIDLREPGKLKIRARGSQLKGRFYFGENPLQVLANYTADEGRFPELPDWAFGTWIGVQGGRETVTEVVAKVKAAGNPVTAVWIQDWVGKRKTVMGDRLNWDWRPNPAHYPNLQDFIQEMNGQGIEVLGYVNPFFVTDGAMGKEAVELGFVILNEEGEPYVKAAGGFDAWQLDLTNPAARDWMAQKINQELIGNGFAGWMADFGEWMPMDAKLWSGESAEFYHNQYPVDWMAVNEQACELSGRGEELVYFSRSGYSGAARHGRLMWAGDQTTNWGEEDGMPSQVRALLSSGMSGISLNHGDVGGYTTVNLPFAGAVRDEEMLFRWMELCAFSTIFRGHEGLRPAENFQPWDSPESLNFYARMGKIHLALKPYLKEKVAEAAERGTPVVRHLWLHYPEDELVRDLDRQYLLGDAILVIPVLEAGEEEVLGYFPSGKWTHLLTGEEVVGGQFEWVRAPLGTPAAFVKSTSPWKGRLMTKFSEMDLK